MKAALKSIAAIICLLSLQVTMAYAEGGSSDAGGSDDISQVIKTDGAQTSSKNMFNLILELYQKSNKSFTSSFPKGTTGYFLFHRDPSEIYIFSSDGTRLNPNSDWGFTYQVKSQGMSADKHQASLNYLFPYTGKINTNYHDYIEINNSANENIGKLADGNVVKLKINRYDNRDFVFGIITTNSNGACYEINSYETSTLINLEPKNNICAVFSMDLKRR